MKNCLKLKEKLIQTVKLFDFNDINELPKFNKAMSDILFEHYTETIISEEQYGLCQEVSVGKAEECILTIPETISEPGMIFTDEIMLPENACKEVIITPFDEEFVKGKSETDNGLKDYFKDSPIGIAVPSKPSVPAVPSEPKFKSNTPVCHANNFYCYFGDVEELVIFADMDKIEEIDWVKELEDALSSDIDYTAEEIFNLLNTEFDNSIFPIKTNKKTTMILLLERGLSRKQFQASLRRAYHAYSTPVVEKNIVVLTEHQQEIFDGVINKIDQIMNIPRGTHIQAVQEAPAKYMTVFEGAAGTGKTTTMSKVLDTLVEKGYSICFCSPTHQALGVIRETLAEANLEFTESPEEFLQYNEGIIIRTLASFLGLKMKRDLETGEESFTTDKKAVTFKVDILAIDESSMVSKDQIMLLLKRLRVDFNMILFIGDEPQLPSPADKNEPNGVFNLPYKYSLLKVVRQAEGSQLLQLAHYIRNLILSNNTAYKPSQIITEQLTNNHDIVVFKDQGLFLREYANDMESRKIISTYTNKTTNEYNSYMRNLAITNQLPGTKLDIDTVGNSFLQSIEKVNYISDWKDYKEFFPGEKLVIGETNQRSGTVIHQNGEIITIESVERVTDSIYIETPSENMMEPSTIVEYKIDYFKIVDTTFRSVFVVANEYKELYTQLLSLLSAEAHRRTGKHKWKKYWDFKEKYTKVNYTFAATLYKLQGSTYGHLYVDLRDLDKFHKWNPVIVYKLLYVALTRPKQKIIILI